ncbi:MAG: circadian clock protein KaiA, partial [Verrucomicrobia bacterium]|nr:circadian clock protein KaiA [Leptolyngbya sp. ES-bin-22]
MNHPPPNPPRSKLSIGVFLQSEALTQALSQRLDYDRHFVTLLPSSDEFFTFVEQEKQSLDCLILQGVPTLPQLAHQLHGQAILLPAVVVTTDAQVDAAECSEGEPATSSKSAIATKAVDYLGLAFAYHTAEIWLTLKQVDAIND